MRGDGVRQPAAQIVRADEGRDAAALGILCDVDSRTRGGLPPLDVGGVGPRRDGYQGVRWGCIAVKGQGAGLPCCIGALRLRQQRLLPGT